MGKKREVLLIRNSVSWLEAEATCQSLGAHLVTIGTRSDFCVMRALETTCNGVTCGPIWVGLRRFSTSPATFHWVDSYNEVQPLEVGPTSLWFESHAALELNASCASWIPGFGLFRQDCDGNNSYICSRSQRRGESLMQL